MKLYQKVAASFAGVGLLVAPVAASAAPVQFDGVRVSSTVDSGLAMGEEAGSSWLLILLGAAAVVGAIIVLADDDNPSSP